jgi:hypothetical protein
MPLSEKRRQEITRLIYEGAEELTEAMSLGEQETKRHLERIHAEITAFLATSTSPEELDFFAENWTRDGREKPIHQLIENPHVDAGTLLRLYWCSDPEYYYSSYRSASEVEHASDREVFQTLERIEHRITRSEYRTASIPFDPAPHVTMPEGLPNSARRIPGVMYRPISGLG